MSYFLRSRFFTYERTNIFISPSLSPNPGSHPDSYHWYPLPVDVRRSYALLKCFFLMLKLSELTWGEKVITTLTSISRRVYWAQAAFKWLINGKLNCFDSMARWWWVSPTLGSVGFYISSFHCWIRCILQMHIVHYSVCSTLKVYMLYKY